MVFKEVVTDEQILEAVMECLDEATVPADCIAKKLKAKDVGIGTRRVRDRLLMLEKEGKIFSKKVGTGIGFRPINLQ
jgi:repressor of nif and glnA expression